MIATASTQQSFALILLMSTISLSSPLILAAMGGYTSERGGVMNIALEGKMLIATVMTALAAQQSGNPAVGMFAGIGAAIVLSLLHWLLTQKYSLDHIISGMAINLIALGGANLLGGVLQRKFSDPKYATLPVMQLEFYLGTAIAMPFILHMVSKHTRMGLRLQAVGSDPDKSRQMGVEPQKIRLWGLVVTGVLCGLAGALMVSSAGAYSDNMTDGKGFIALAALILGGWRPIPALVACVAFGCFQGLQIQLQGTSLFGAEIPRELWSSLPYVVTVFALIGLMGRSRAPAGLGKP